MRPNHHQIPTQFPTLKSPFPKKSQKQKHHPSLPSVHSVRSVVKKLQKFQTLYVFAPSRFPFSIQLLTFSFLALRSFPSVRSFSGADSVVGLEFQLFSFYPKSSIKGCKTRFLGYKPAPPYISATPNSTY
jgi:hypothetical protein